MDRGKLMNEYFLLYNSEPMVIRFTKQAYLEAGFDIYYEDDSALLVKKTPEEKNKNAEDIMLKTILSRFQRSSLDRPVSVDLSPIMNKHIDRLTEENFKNFKFHDLFLDDLRSLVTRAMLNSLMN